MRLVPNVFDEYCFPYIMCLQLAKNDTYGRIGYGNVQLYTAPSTRKTAEEERKAQERYSRVSRLSGSDHTKEVSLEQP